jgi:hypothetical protein
VGFAARGSKNYTVCQKCCLFCRGGSQTHPDDALCQSARTCTKRSFSWSTGAPAVQLFMLGCVLENMKTFGKRYNSRIRQIGKNYAVSYFLILIFRCLGASLGIFVVVVTAITALIAFAVPGDNPLLAAVVVLSLYGAIIWTGVLIGALA